MAPTTVVAAAEPCRIVVVDKDNGWPVPLVELRTVHGQRFVTDNAGVIALGEPELMDRKVWFHIRGHGYGVQADGFGNRGVRITPRPGATVRIEVERTIIAKRLGRITGAGLFAESQKLGDAAEWRESGIVGCDSVQTAVHRGRHFWLWGDTSLYRYPLGIFHASSATTSLAPLTELEPPIRLEFDYFRNDAGQPRGVAEMPGDGPTWLTGYVSLPDLSGADRLVASYSKIEPPLDTYETGLCIWDDAGETFVRERVIWRKSADAATPPAIPEGHPLRWTDGDGRQWILFGNPFPTLKIPATFEAWSDPTTWRAVQPQATLAVASDPDRTIRPHSGSIAFHPYRGRFVAVFMQHLGAPSAFGELWYAEAPTPTGPWGPAVKVLSHDNYTFYNPRLHPEFTPTDSAALVFEGTYTAMFADAPAPTPRYDYNQVLYRLDLDDERLRGAHVQH